MLKNVDEFLLCRPYAGIWELVVGRFEQSKAIELQQHERIFSPTTWCHKNDQFVWNAILVQKGADIKKNLLQKFLLNSDVSLVRFKFMVHCHFS